MKKLYVSMLALMSLTMAGCNSMPRQSSLALADGFYSNKEKVVGIYLKDLPKADTHLVGASCLLCYAVASAANSSLTDHITTLSTDDLAGLGKEIAHQLAGKGIKTVPITSVIDFETMENYPEHEEGFSYTDLRPLREKLGVDKLIVININAMGAYRPYSSYVPTGGAVGTVMGVAYTVDLATNKYELYEEIDFKIAPVGEWDEPPSFPGVTSAYYQAVELTKDKVIALFK